MFNPKFKLTPHLLNNLTKIERLYGVKEAFWKHLSYSQALELKNTLAKRIIESIHNKGYQYVTNDDTLRKDECVKAIRFNEGLLNE